MFYFILDLLNRFSLYLKEENTLLFKWQTILGAILGVVGAFAISSLTFIINNFYTKHKNLRENIRLTEVNLALAINDVLDAEDNLNLFLGRLYDNVIKPLKNNPPVNQYFLNETNFPSMSIHFEPSLLAGRYKSYYIHNKILVIIKSIKAVNHLFEDLKTKYSDIIKKAEFFMQRGATPVNQQEEYLSNNEAFEFFIKDIYKANAIRKENPC